MMGKDDFIEYLSVASKQIGLDLSSTIMEQYYRYMKLLLEWNQKINLTSITEPQDIALKHFIDSIVIFSKVEVKLNSTIIDVGTGAGFPGLAMKIFRPDLNVMLLDSLQKRVSYLNEVTDQLGLKGIEVVHGRAEEVAQKQNYREVFDLVVARAVAKMPVLAEYCLPFARVGGKFVAFKGPEVSEELKSSAVAVFELGGKISETIEIALPIVGDSRRLVLVDKIKESPVKYPRKAGQPEKKPIGMK